MQGKMENSSAYHGHGPSPIPTHQSHPAAALVAFSQASSLSEALRLSRPFPQSSDGKDLNNPFSTVSLGGLRPSEVGAAAAAAAAAAAHHHGLTWPFLNLHNPFFHHVPSLDPRLPFGTGAFRPLTPGEETLKSSFHPGAAFAAAGLTPPHHQQQQQQQQKGHHHHQGGGGKIESLPFNLSRYNPFSSAMESSMAAAGRLVFNSNGQRVIQGQPESPSNNNNNNNNGAAHVAASSAMSPSGTAGCADSSSHPSSAASSSNNNNDGRDAAGTPLSDAATERSTPDELRTSRRRKKSPLDPSCCPVCGITLRSSDLEVHFVQELERLERVSRTFRSSSSSSHHHHHHHHGSGSSVSPSGSSGSMSAPAATSQVQKREQDSRWETFHRIRINRTNRVRAKARKRRADEREDTPENGHHLHPHHHHHGAIGGGNAAGSSGSSSNTPCPICGQRMYGSAEELNQHVVQCLRRNGEDADEDEPLDVEGDSYEEYEWAGQRRIRASTMLEGGFGGVGMHICKAGDEETEDVVVDGDDTAAFGQPQFNEHDIQTAAADHSSQEEGLIKCEMDAQMSSSYKETDSKDHIINALKNRVCDLEEMNKEAKQKNRCLICLGDYRQPVVSTSCWHVHCEECWLQALGNKKLCPQCNLITSPTHLRRIYM